MITANNKMILEHNIFCQYLNIALNIPGTSIMVDRMIGSNKSGNTNDLSPMIQ